jgi:hypothetical protein
MNLVCKLFGHKSFTRADKDDHAKELSDARIDHLQTIRRCKRCGKNIEWLVYRGRRGPEYLSFETKHSDIRDALAMRWDSDDNE